MTAENFRTIWLKPDDPTIVQIIDQRLLPHEYKIHDLRTWQDAEAAIADMYVRAAPLIGATAAWGLYLAALADSAFQSSHDSGPPARTLSIRASSSGTR